jgi:hypothetical protein
MAKILFAPFSIIGGFLAGFAATKLFEFIWSQIDEQKPPGADARRTTWPKLIIALLIEGAVFRAVRGAFDHGARTIFYRGTRVWPGDEAPDEA